MANFEDVKRSTTFEKAMNLLGLELKRTKPNQFRGPCPCGKGGDRALCLTEGQGFYCWGSHASGSVIDLVMHVRRCNEFEAGNFLAGTVGTVPSTVGTRGTVPESGRGNEPTKKFDPLAYAAKLDPDHPSVLAAGISPEFAKKHLMGFCKAGQNAGLVAFPIRDENGEVVCFAGTTELKLPAQFTPNVVSLHSKKTA